MSKKKFLVTGDSYTQGCLWPSVLYEHYNVINVGKAACGSVYMSDSILGEIDLDDPPSHVFVLWGCINRYDVKLPSNKVTDFFLSNKQYFARIKDTCYYFTGGDHYNDIISKNYKNIKSSTWPSVDGVEDYLLLPEWIQKECHDKGIFDFSLYSIDGIVKNFSMLQFPLNQQYLEDQTLYSMIHCQNFLKANNIPYNFSFVADPFSTPMKSVANLIDVNKFFGSIQKTNPLNKKIDWSRYILLNPYNFAVAHDYLQDDLMHMTEQGQEKWANAIRKFLQYKW